MFVLLVAFTLANVRRIERWDGQTLSINDHSARYIIARDQIRDVTLTIWKESVGRFHPNKPPNQFLSRGPGARLNINTVHGGLLIFKTMDYEELIWLKEAMDCFLRSAPPSHATPNLPASEAEKTAIKPRPLVLPKTLLALAVVMLAWSMRNLSRGLAERHWASVQGVVLDPQSAYSDRISDPESWEYQYKVGDRVMASSRISYNPLHIGDTAFMRRHPPGTFVTIYYDPANIEHCVAIAGTESQDWMLSLNGIMFLMLGVWLALQKPNQEAIALAHAYGVNSPYRQHRL
jgi:hypothetical protein